MGAGAGGTGFDKAVFAGEFDSYTIAKLGNGVMRVSGPDGTDMLANVEQLGFANATIIDDVADRLSDPLAPLGAARINRATAGFLEALGDRDWFGVQFAAGRTYVLVLQGLSSGNGSLADPYLRLHDAGGALIAENDNDGGNPDSRLVFTPAAGGTFYLEAGAHADNSVGVYHLVINPLVNHAPIIASNGGGDAATLFMRESLGFVTAVAASDPDPDPDTPVAYAITGGADGNQFQIDPSGALHFTLPPDHEHPADSDRNNVYVVQVGATDGSLWDMQTLTVVVTDANDAILSSAAPADFQPRRPVRHPVAPRRRHGRALDHGRRDQGRRPAHLSGDRRLARREGRRVQRRRQGRHPLAQR